MLDQMFVLSKKSWHVRLMKWVWGFTPSDFSWGCPYFWLTVLNVIVVIPFSIIKVIILAVVKIVDFGIDYSEQQKQKKYQKLLLEIKKDPELQDRIIKNRIIRKFLDWLLYNSDGDVTMYNLLKSKRQFWMDKEDTDSSLRAARRILKTKKTNKERINKIVKFFKPIGIVLMWLLFILMMLTLVVMLVKMFLFFYHLSHKAWMSFWKAVLYSIATIGIIAALFLLGYLIYSSVSIKTAFKKTGRGIKQASSATFTPFANAFKFIISMIKDACPAIQWKD